MKTASIRLPPASAVLRIFLVVLMLGGLSAFMMWMAGAFNETITPGELAAAEPASNRATVVVRPVEQPVFEQATGTLRPDEETFLSSRITARILSIAVREGDTVEAGDVLVELQQRDLLAQVSQAEEEVASARATLIEAERDFARTAELLEVGASSASEYDRAETRLANARAALQGASDAVDEAQARLSYATVASPLAGRVAERRADPGDTATPGAPLLNLYNPATLRLEANVRESLALGLSQDQMLRVTIDAAGLDFEAPVDEIVPLANAASRTVLVKVQVPESARVYPGMFGRLRIPLGTESMLYVPEEAISRIGQLEFVRVAGPEGPERRFIRTGKPHPAQGVPVISGLREGDEVLMP